MRKHVYKIIYIGSRYSLKIPRKPLISLVGPPRFELGTSCTPSKRASQAAPRPDPLKKGPGASEQRGTPTTLSRNQKRKRSDACTLRGPPVCRIGARPLPGLPV